jgi:hypothetical protein
LKSLFAGVCQEFHIPYANGHGWGDLNVRADMMGRFKHWEAKGKRCVLLYCGDLDPMGLKISECLKENMREVEAVGWSPDNLQVDRFGLNEAFVTAHNLTWIDGLATGGQGIVDPKTGKKVKYPLDDPRHPDHWKPYVQDYLHRYCERNPDGTWHGRKVEADAMVVKSAESRALLRATIHKYLPDDAPAAYERALLGYRQQARNETIRLVRAWYR